MSVPSSCCAQVDTIDCGTLRLPSAWLRQASSIILTEQYLHCAPHSGNQQEGPGVAAPRPLIAAQRQLRGGSGASYPAASGMGVATGLAHTWGTPRRATIACTRARNSTFAHTTSMGWNAACRRAAFAASARARPSRGSTGIVVAVPTRAGASVRHAGSSRSGTGLTTGRAMGGRCVGRMRRGVTVVMSSICFSPIGCADALSPTDRPSGAS